MDIVGNYNLEVKIGDVIVPVLPQMIEELTIAQDIDRLVPTFNFRVKDVTNLLGLIVPYDKSSNKITLTISRERFTDKRNEFIFSVKRRRTLSDRSYEVDGILETTGLFSPYRSRALSGNLKTTIENIALNEIGLKKTEVGSSLNYVKTVLQPAWDNGHLLRYLKQRIKGRSGETCYYCFIKNLRGESTLVFKSIEEMLLPTVKYKFMVGAKPFEDFYPVSDYRIFDNSQFRAFFNSKVANYRYFNYSTGQYTVSTSVNLDNCPSLSEYYLVDKDDDTDKNFSFFGRSNDFTDDFSGRAGQQFYHSMINSVSMWISTWGLEDIGPGDITLVLFSEALNRGNPFVYQHTGLWMVKRVVHIIGSSFMTNLLLVRPGIDTDIATTLTPTVGVRKQ